MIFKVRVFVVIHQRSRIFWFLHINTSIVCVDPVLGNQRFKRQSVSIYFNGNMSVFGFRQGQEK